MPITPVKKIQLAAVSSHKDKILDVLQNFGWMHISDITENSPLTIENKQDYKDIQKIELNYANIEYAIKVLSPYSEKKGLLEGPITLSEEELINKAKEYDFNKVVNECNEIEDKISKTKNELNFLKNEQNTYTPWKNLPLALENAKGTTRVKTAIGTLRAATYEEAEQAIKNIDSLVSIESIHKDEKFAHVVIIFDITPEKQVRQILSEYKFAEVELPAKTGLLKDYLHEIKEKIQTNEHLIKEEEKKLKHLAKELDNLKIAHDYVGWQKDKSEAKRKLGSTEYSFVVNAWIPAKRMEELSDTLEKYTKEYTISELELEEGETPPVIIENNATVWPFETLTRMYGLPRHDELDPTPYLSAFFILFFALCLTDAAYGIIMFTIMALALKYMKLGEGVKRLAKLLMYGGLVTFVVGALFGGWFGFEAAKMPEFLTYVNAEGEKMFLFQQINSVTNPLIVLILALGLGFVQILFGVYLKFFHAYIHGDKKDAILGTGSWAFMLTGIGFFIISAAGVLPAPAQTIGQWWVILGAVALILTQGRDKKNPITKLLSGVLSLYGLVSYMSDILSYSRLLALGLATTIIALAVNVIVDLAAGMPYIGWLLAIIIFIGGHVFNLVINTLGSFIHSGRLQFVEFFSKFMEGGGKEFRAFGKKNKYVYVKNNN